MATTPDPRDPEAGFARRLLHRWPWLVALAAVVVGAWFFFGRGRGGGDEAMRFLTSDVTRGPLEARVTATGTLQPLVTVQVGSQVSGRLKEIYVDYNDPVKQGQVIARLDPQLFEAALAQARANFTAAKGNLAKAQAQAHVAVRQRDRMRRLATQKLVTQADLDTAEGNAEAAQAGVSAATGQVEQARAALNQAKVNLGYTTIRSPINGVVISRNVDVGQTVAASFQAPTLFVLAKDLAHMEVHTSVAEADVGKLRAGMPAEFTVDAHPYRDFEGTVRQVRNAPQTVQNVVTYDTVIDVSNPGLLLKPGMTANVTFVYAKRADALLVPNAALRFRPAPGMFGGGGDGGMHGGRNGRRAGRGHRNGANGARANGARPGGARPGGAHRTAAVASRDDPRRPRGDGAPGLRPEGGPARDGAAAPLRAEHDRRAVWVVRNGRPERVPVRIGISDGVHTEIVSGELRPGDKVITGTEGGSGGRNGHRHGFRFL